MNPSIFILCSLMTTSITLVVVLSIAWTGFGRPRHALSWAAAYGLGSLLWGVGLVSTLLSPGTATPRLIAVILGAIVPTLIMLGFRQRAGLNPRLKLVIASVTAFIVVASYAGIFHRYGAADRALLPLFIALTELVAATTLVGRGWKSNLAERAMFAALLLFATLNLALGLYGLFRPGGAELPAFGVLALLVTPTVYTVTGLFSVFLLAVDLAETMRRLAILDPLTGVLNRRGLEQAAEQAIANSRRGGQPLSVVMADLDRFKELNDSRGHAAGDRALARFATHVEHAVRRGDLVGRIGGEEFALLLANTDAATALEVAERIRGALSGLDIGLGDRRLTCSFGVAELAPIDGGFADVSSRADAALYLSKLGGRDRVTLADLPVSNPVGATAARP